MPPEQKKAMRAIMACRTGELGAVHYVCASCGHFHVMGRSCGNRHCPTCQQHKTKAWLEKQTETLLPCSYFLITFTVPMQLRPFVRAHQRFAYKTLFDASSEALKKLAADPKHMGANTAGFSGVLHTWGRTLEYHPHVHYIVPGGGVLQTKNGAKWKPSRINFYVPVKALSVIYRAKFRDAIRQAGFLSQIDPAVWTQDWVVHSKAVGDGRTSLQYLAPYVFRVAISDRRIVRLDDTHVTFSYRKSGSKRSRTMTVTSTEFIRRFLQHVLPSGFQKVRHYGFLSPNSRASVEAVRWLVILWSGGVFVLCAAAAPIRFERQLQCPVCGGPLRIVAFVWRVRNCLFDTS
jgi:hypothetical protein